MTVTHHIRLVFISLFLSSLMACGGGGDSSDSAGNTQPPQATTQPYSVTVIDGYLRTATVWLDINNNGLQDTDEPTSVTQGNGKATLTVSSDIDPSQYSVIVYAEAGKTFDESLNSVVDRDFILASPEGEQIITPLTTLVYLKSRNTFDKDSAASIISLKLGLLSQNLFEDFIATGNTDQITLAADLVRLTLMPEKKDNFTNLLVDSKIVFDNLEDYLALRTRGDSQVRVIRDSNGKLSGDTDLDGIADSEDKDIDGDFILNALDAFPYNSAEWEDLDNDGIGNNSDPDIDGDNVGNEIDIFPLDPSEWEDLDNDSIGNNSDPDIDGDSVENEIDIFPLDSTEWEDLDNDGIGNNSDPDIDGDSIENEIDIFPLDSTEWEDLDNDGIGNNSDPDIDGDGMLNENDQNPYLAEFNTINNPGELNLSQAIEGNITQGKWQYFTVESPGDTMLNITLANLSGDIDLYIGQSEFPTKFEYLCRSNLSNNQTEKCVERVQQETSYSIGIFARQDSSFNLTATLETIVYKKAMLLLHGLASDADTWKSMIDDDSFFNGQCQTLTYDSGELSVSELNKDGISCFSLEFGSLDRGTSFSEQGLDNKACNSALGCNGDYTTFDGLGFEVERAITLIAEHLGQDTEIFMLGHSRGGLAARAYLQNEQTTHKSLVKGFATTGTPHQGSPLGRFYQYMHDNCIPESIYRQDGSICEDNWEVIEMLSGRREFFGFNYSKEHQMDLQAPSVSYLSPDSASIQNLNNNLSSLGNLVIGQLAYEGTYFGILSKDAGVSDFYDLYAYGTWFSGDHPHPDTLRYIENGQTRASFIGDGIVPSYSQKLSFLLEKEGIFVNKQGIQKAVNILHTEETSQVSDINWLFEDLYLSLGWK